MNSSLSGTGMNDSGYGNAQRSSKYDTEKEPRGKARREVKEEKKVEKKAFLKRKQVYDPKRAIQKQKLMAEEQKKMEIEKQK